MAHSHLILALVLGITWSPSSPKKSDCSSCYQHLKVEIGMSHRQKKILFVSVKPEMDNHETVWVNQDGSVGINPALTEIRFYKDLTVVANEKEYGSKGYCAKRKDMLTLSVKKIKSIKLIEGMRETYGPVAVCR